MKRRNFRKIFTIGFFICGLCSLMASGQTKKDKDQAKKLIGEGDSALQQKLFADALDKYSKSILLVSNDPDAHFGKANAYYALKQYMDAKSEFELALNQGYKTPVTIYTIRWQLLFDLSDYDGALTDLTKGLALQPKNLDFIIGKGDVYVAQKKFKEALAAYQTALNPTPKTGAGDIYYKIANAYAQQIPSDAKAQRDAADMAINSGTRMIAEAYFLLADGAKKQRDYPAAIKAYEAANSAFASANSKRPNRYDAFIDLADMYGREGKFDEAARVLDRARLVFTEDGRLYNYKARYESLAGHPERAVEAARVGTEKARNEYIGFTNLCRAYNELKKYDDAIFNCNKALALKPGDGETNFYLGNAYLQKNQTSVAKGYYTAAEAGLLRESTQSKSDYADGWYLLGGAYFQNNKTDLAIDAYKRSVEISPNFAKARFNLGFLYTIKKDKKSAQEQYDALLAISVIQPAAKQLAANLKAEIDKM